MSQLVISAEQIAFSYSSEAPILKSVSLHAYRGEILVIFGPSGEGKSTLLKILAGLLKPLSGQVLIHGKALHELPRKQQKELQLQMGFLFQKNALFDSFTVEQNITFPLIETGRFSETEAKAHAYTLLNDVGLSQSKDLFPSELSGGMQKRLGFARSMALFPPMLFLDDPTAGLDPITGRHIINIVKKSHETAKSTVICVTNELSRATQMAHRMALLMNGEILCCEKTEDFLNSKDIRVRNFIQGLRVS